MIDDGGWPSNPFPGIEPFGVEHRHLFFGRDRDAETLLRRTVMYRGTLLYGEQGVGKSSILNAGLVPRVFEAGYEPWRIRVQPVPGRELILESSAPAEWRPGGRGANPADGRVTLAAGELAATVARHDGSRRLLLIFDQFEEWITLFEYMPDEESAGRAEAAQVAIRDAVVHLVLAKELPVKVFLTFREDYLAKMTPIFDRAPNLPDHFVRLLPVAGSALTGAIRGPFERFPERYSPGFSEDLAATIVADLANQAPGRNVRTTELQIVCRELYGGDGSDPAAAYREAGGADGLLRRYFTSALDAIDHELRDPAVVLLTRLVSPAGTRNVVSRDDVLRRVELEEGLEPEMLGRALGALDRDAKLAKRQRREDVDYYEIASEFLIDWIAEQRERLRTRALEERIEEQDAVIEEQQSRLVSLAGRLTVGSVIALLGAQLLVLSLFMSWFDDSSAFDVGIAAWGGPVLGIAAAGFVAAQAIRERPMMVRTVGLAFIGSIAAAFLVASLWAADLLLLDTATGLRVALVGSVLAALGCFLELRWRPKATGRVAAVVALPLLLLGLTGSWISDHLNFELRTSGTVVVGREVSSAPFLNMEGFGAFDLGSAAWLGPALAAAGVLVLLGEAFPLRTLRPYLHRVAFGLTATGAFLTFTAYPELLSEDLVPDWRAVVAVLATALAGAAGFDQIAGTAGPARMRLVGRVVAVAAVPVLLAAPFLTWGSDGRSALDWGLEWWAGPVIVAAGAALALMAAVSLRGRRARTAVVGFALCLVGAFLGAVLFADHHVTRASYNEPVWAEFFDGEPLPTLDRGFYVFAVAAVAATFAAFGEIGRTRRATAPRWTFGRVAAAGGVVALGVSLLLPWTEVDSRADELDVVNTANALDVGFAAWGGVVLVMAGAAWLVARAFERSLASSVAGASIVLGTTLIALHYVIEFDRQWGVVIALVAAAVTAAGAWQRRADARLAVLVTSSIPTSADAP